MILSPCIARRAAAPLAFALIACATLPARAGATPDEVAALPTLEVFVTDKKGNPVTDLELADFEVRVDGREANVAAFRQVLGGEIANAEDGETNVPRSLVVYFDRLHLTPASRNQMVERLRTFLPEQAGAGVEVMLASSDGAITIHESFTTDPARIRLALNAIERLVDAHDLPSERMALDCLLGGSSDPRCNRMIEGYSAELYERTMAALPPLEALVLDLGSVPGHKWVLYVGDALPLQPAEEIRQVLQGGIGMTSGVQDLTPKVDVVTEAATSNGVAFYTYRSTALTARVSSVSAANPYQPGDATSLFGATRQRNYQSGPTRLSMRTGGWTAGSPKDALEWLANDLNAFYSLVFGADVATSGRYHEVKIKVDRKKTVVRHPDGYHDHRVKNPQL